VGDTRIESFHQVRKKLENVERASKFMEVASFSLNLLYNIDETYMDLCQLPQRDG
jgi:hypothetical protein